MFAQKVGRKILVKLTPGVSMSPNMFCDFYLGKNSKIANNQHPQKLEKKNWKPNNFIIFLMKVWINLKTIKFYLIGLATDF
jgi:hypothetical protein